MDATLLETEYDAVIVGTGMAEAILAGALARVGKKVLHLDQNDYYGSNYASFPLEQFRRWTQNEAIAPRSFDEENDQPLVAPPAESLVLPENARVVRMQSSVNCHLVDEKFLIPEEEQAEMLRKSAQFSIDVNPRLVLSSEEIVQLLIESGVGRYLEFAAIERTYVLVDEGKTANADAIWEVPCSKKDVFASKLLGMVEKRMLMKFLQFVADYGETHILGEDVMSKNERELALGRSLKRPQNKVNQVDATEGSEIESYLDRPFQELLSKHFKLSPKLQQVVVYCVALASFPVDTESGESHARQVTAREGLAAVYRYVASIGRFTGNAFLVPLYGVGEITQSFCRLCAVYGGIYVLRAPIDAFVVDQASKKVLGIRCTLGESGDKGHALIKAKHVITNASYLKSFSHELAAELSSSQVLRGIFLLNTALRDAMNRFMIVIPPNDATLKNPFVVQAIQLDHGAYICPKDRFLVQITTPLPTEWHGDKAKQLELMEAVIKKLITSAEAEKATSGHKTAAHEEEAAADLWENVILWQAVFAMDHYLFPYSNATKRADYIQPEGLPSNLWVSETPFGHESNALNPLEIHLESSSVNARAIFEKICPGEAFLPKSASAEQAEREELEDEEDAVLKAAQKLASQADLGASPGQDAFQMELPAPGSESSIEVELVSPPPPADAIDTAAAPVQLGKTYPLHDAATSSSKHKRKRKGTASSKQQAAAMDLVKQQVDEAKRIWKNKRQLSHQVLNLAMVMLTALMLWKGLMLYTESESPVVVVLSGSMEPAFQRGDILYLDNTKPHLDIGDIVVYKIKDRDIPIVHRVLEKHQRASDGHEVYLTKGDNNNIDDRGLYAEGQLWLEREDVVGIARASVPYAGMLTILLNDYPMFKYILVGGMGLLVFTQRE